MAACAAKCSAKIAVALGLALALSSAVPCVAAGILTVSAAASLTDAFREIAARFDADHPGLATRLNFAASGVLLRQIDQGAPVDVFAAADADTMDRALARQLVIAGSRREFATNTLVLVVPNAPPASARPAAMASIADLAEPHVRRIAIGKAATVPVGRYTRESLESAGLWTVLQPKFILADSARQVLDYVARAEVEAGIVYQTDAARMADRVRVIETLGGHSPVRYPVAVVAGSREEVRARAFVDYLGGDTAKAILASHGFGSPR